MSLQIYYTREARMQHITQKERYDFLKSLTLILLYFRGHLLFKLSCFIKS